MQISAGPPLALLASVTIATSGPAPAIADEMAAGRIQIAYVPPKDPAHQPLYALLQQRRALEKVQTAFGAFRLPRDVTVRTIGCDGVANAWYQPIDGRPTVTLCYEYLQEVWEKLPQQTNMAGVTQVDALAGQLFFAVAHEFGHLSFDVYGVPVFGREEDAADNFATYIMLHFRDDARRLVGGAAWSYNMFIKDFKDNPKATLPLAAFSSNHGQPEERYYNLLCITYGSDQKHYADLVENGYLPQARAKDCKYEFDVLQFAFQQQIMPHIDQERASQVMVTDWLTGVVPPPPMR